MYLLATILSLDNVVALCKKPHLPAQLISMPEKSFAIGYRNGLLVIYLVKTISYFKYHLKGG